MKYVDSKIVLSEIPNEITLAINISGCKIRCKDCHSKYLWEDIGKELNCKELHNIIDSNNGITCICIMGGDHDIPTLKSLFKDIKESYPTYKTAWYSGNQSITEELLEYLDYIKVGPYIKERGPLTEPTTNQILFKIFHTRDVLAVTDITNLFWKKIALEK